MTRQPLSIGYGGGVHAVGGRIRRTHVGSHRVHVLRFGESCSFGDWTFLVSEPTPFVPSDGALDADRHGLAVKVRFTIANTSRSREVSTSGIYVQVQVDGQKASKIYDRRQQLGCLPPANLPPDRAMSWHEGYGYDALGQQLTIRVSDLLDFDGPIAMYGGAL